MSHPNFESAGAGPGTEIWTIENFEPVPVDIKSYGKFYNGDSYIVLQTTGESKSSLHYDAHFWLGSKASQDKLGAAAIWTVTLDDSLGGRAVHHREVQGHESALFLGYFKPAIRYMEGGNESGFTEVETNAGAEKRLLKLSGCDNMRIEEVAAQSSSLTADHCFILEVDHDIFVLMPEGAKATQRRKIISVANSLRDDYHNGRATIEIIDDFSSDEDYALFFAALGSGSKEDLANDDSSETYSRDDISAVYLYRAVLGESLDVVALSKPYKQKHLSSNEVYILDTPDSGVYVWLGAGLGADIKRSYHDVASQYLQLKGYPTWVNVTRVTESAESSTFMQYFHDWETVSSGGRALVAESGNNFQLTKKILNQNFEPVPVDIKSYGKFYNGDSYIVLQTTGESKSSLHYDAHFWLGSKASQDKLGAAAIWTVTLDDSLGGRAVHHREVQGHESALFLGYFKPAIRYMEGGNESGFTEVETNAGAEKRLLKLSGCDNMRIEEVAAQSSSLTADHCFILEVDHDIFVLMPEGAKATQRRKIISVANSLRDDYHNGRATIEIIDDFSSDEDYALFFAALGSGSKEDLANDDSSETYSRDDISAVYLYRAVLGESLDVVALSKPYKQKHLSSNEVYILDTPDSGVYVWLGAGLGADIKRSYHDVASQYLQLKGYPTWVNVTRVTESAESSTFMQYFHDWETVSSGGRALVAESDAGYYSGDAEEAAAVAKLIGKSAAARGYMPDTGEGNLSIIRIAGDQEDVTDSMLSGVSILYQSEVYVVKYRYADGDADAYVVYTWVGADASSSDKAAALDLMSEMEADLERVTLVRIPQGKETKHFLTIFKGALVIVFGSKENGYKPENANGTYDDDGIRLFRVEGTELGVDMRAVQVPERAGTLEDDDVFVLATEAMVYVWNGKEANSKELEAALNFVQRLVGEERETLTVQQGEEPDEFWTPLGGISEEKEDPSAWKLAVNRRVTTPRTLTAVTVKVTGKISFEDLDEKYSQQDLSDDGVYILDTGEELYLWQGTNIPERVRAAREDIVKEYIMDDGLERTVDSALVVTLKQGSEPAVFKKLFPQWEDDMWDNQVSYEDMKSDTKAANSK